MSDVLTKDTDLALPNFTLVSASAGSGKTDALTHRYLQFILSEKIPNNNLSSILAITFTNNAAREMKQRILSTLKMASFGDATALSRIEEVVSLERELLVRRAGELVTTILDNYSDFQVQTIDSFVARLLKSSALEFGLPINFELVLETDAILDEALDLFARAAARDSSRLRLLEQLVDLIEETRTGKDAFLWNPYAKLSTELKKIHTRLTAYSGVLIEQEYAHDLRRLGKKILESLRAIGDFAEKSTFKIATNYVRILELARQGDIGTLLGRKLTQPVLHKSREKEYESTAAHIERMQEQLLPVLGEYFLVRARAHYQPYVRAFNMLQQTLSDVERRRGELSLGKANKFLAEHLDREAVPEVYFSLGESIHHFLIDEFQDTSPLQWAALRPLMENSLAGKGSLFIVGDTKQSIYSFRGADWRIMRSMWRQHEFPSVETERTELGTNWRSTAAIVDTSLKIFHEIIPPLEPDIADASGLASFTQNVKDDAQDKGYVEMTIFDPPAENDGHDADNSPEKVKLLAILGDCLARGYLFKEIAILTPRNDEVIEVSRWLNQNRIKFLSHSSLDIRRRKITGELIALLRFLDSPVDDLAFATFLLGDVFASCASYTSRKDPAGMRSGTSIAHGLRDVVLAARGGDHHGVPLYTVFRQRYPDLWKNCFEQLFTLVGYLPLYDLTAQAYTTFNLFAALKDEEATLVKLLEVIRDFEESGSNSLKDFLVFAETNDDDSGWTIEAPAEEDAVKVMTVHKAKGLGFPVVILLFYDSSGQHSNLYVEQAEDGIRLLHITKDAAGTSPELMQRYESLQQLRKVDDLNKLYVAMTRAREEMYFLSVKAKKGDEPSRYLPESGYQLGTRSRRPAQFPPKRRSAAVVHIPTRGLTRTGTSVTLGLEETRRGDLIHALLAQIQFLDDTVETVVTDSLAKVRATSRMKPDAEDMFTLLQQFLRAAEVRELFARRTGRRVLNEQEVVTNDGRLKRLDRLIVDEDLVTVVDFKTGGEREEYLAQVREYTRLAGELFPGKERRGVLAYVDLKRVRGVA